MTLSAHYQVLLDAGDLEPDPAQAEVVSKLQTVYDQLLQPAPRRGFLQRLPALKRPPPPLVKGLYIWGSVGRGKTWLVDLFYNHLPLTNKRRVHFHRLMQEIHEQLAQLKGQTAPLELVAENLANQAKVLCLDEFIVIDIGDAMILSQLLKALFARGVTLITTSNTHPDLLYLDGIQRSSSTCCRARISESSVIVSS